MSSAPQAGNRQTLGRFQPVGRVRRPAFVESVRGNRSTPQSLPRAARNVTTTEEKALFWRIFWDHTIGNQTDWMGMAKEWNITMSEGRGGGEMLGVFVKTEKQLRKYAKGLTKKFSAQDALYVSGNLQAAERRGFYPEASGHNSASVPSASLPAAAAPVVPTKHGKHEKARFCRPCSAALKREVSLANKHAQSCPYCVKCCQATQANPQKPNYKPGDLVLVENCTQPLVHKNVRSRAFRAS